MRKPDPAAMAVEKHIATARELLKPSPVPGSTIRVLFYQDES